MKLHCPISGLYYSAPYLHYAPYTTTATHPSLTLNDKQLLALLEQSDAPENIGLDTTDQRVSYYLLHIAMLARLPVQFRTAVDFQAAYPHLVQHSQALRHAVVHTISVPTHELPGYAVTKTNADLANLGSYLDSIHDAMRYRIRTNRERARIERIAAQEQKLDRLIYAQSRYQINQLAKMLPDWADQATGGFPTFIITLPSGDTMPLALAWKRAITLSITGEHYRLIGMYRKQDIEELIEHLEDNLELGTPYCAKLLRALRTSLDVIKDFMMPRKAVRQKQSSPAVLDLSALDDAPEAEPTSTRLTLQQLLAQRRAKK